MTSSLALDPYRTPGEVALVAKTDKPKKTLRNRWNCWRKRHQWVSVGDAWTWFLDYDTRDGKPGWWLVQREFIRACYRCAFCKATICRIGPEGEFQEHNGWLSRRIVFPQKSIFIKSGYVHLSGEEWNWFFDQIPSKSPDSIYNVAGGKWATDRYGNEIRISPEPNPEDYFEKETK